MYIFLQQYWWLVVSLLGAILVFLLFVQDGLSKKWGYRFVWIFGSIRFCVLGSCFWFRESSLYIPCGNTGNFSLRWR